MRTFNEIRTVDANKLEESRLLRKGGVLLLAKTAKRHGDDATKYFYSAKRKIKGSSLDSEEERIKSIQEGLQDLCEGLISIRKQNGAITGIVSTAVVINERTNAQIQKISQK
jgi:hypothetical protein